MLSVMRWLRSLLHVINQSDIEAFEYQSWRVNVRIKKTKNK